MKRVLVIAATVLGLLLLVGWMALPTLAQKMIERLGDDLQARVIAIGPTAAELEAVRYAEVIAAERLTLRYTPLGLLLRRIDQVEIDALRVTELPEAGAGGGPAWRIDEIVLRDAQAALTGDGWSATAAAEGRIWLDGSRIRQLDLPVLRLAAKVGQEDLSLIATAEGGAGPDHLLRLSLDIPWLYAAGVATQRFGLRSEGLLTATDQGLAYDLTAPGRLTAARFQVRGLFGATAPFTAAVTPSRLLALDMGDGGLVIRPDLALGPAKMTAQVESSEKIPLQLSFDALRAGGAWQAEDGGFTPTGRLDGGRVELMGMVLDRLTVVAEGEAGQAVPHVTAAARLQDKRKPAAMVPLAFDARLRPQGGAFEFDAGLKDDSGRLDLSLDGKYGAGGGAAAIKLKRLAFGDGLQPPQLFPALDGAVGQTTGSLDARGLFRWGAGGFQPRLELLVRDLSGSYGGISFKRLNSVVQIDNFSPLSTPGGQEASVALVEAGLPLTNGLLQFSIKNGILHLSSGQLDLAKGRVTVKDARLDPAAKQQRLWLDVAGVELGTLVSLIQIDGLAASGRLDGTVPLELQGSSMRVAGGTLTAGQPGRLRYAPKTPPAALTGGGPAGMLLQALGDFRYQKLSLGLDGQSDGEIVAKLSLSGANPAFYDGYPVELNLNVSGRLGLILSDALTGYQIPDRIAERMAGFEKAQTTK